MSVAIPFHKHTVGRTFMVAITILGLGALAQFSALSWLFFTRYRALGGEEATTPAVPSGSVTTGRDFADPFADPSTPAAANLPSAQPPPRPVPMPALEGRPSGESEMSDRLAELIDQGKMLRERGDTYASVTKLREAEAMAEHDPLPTAELAMTYEKMGFSEKAAECWKRIYEMGEAAGVYYAAAEGRLKALGDPAKSTGTEAVGGSASGSVAGVQSSAGAKGDAVGLNGNCKLGLQEITRREENDASAKRKFVLQVPIKAKSRARIDVHDVIVQVVFYDIVNGKALDRTNATVNYKWSAPPADWAEDDVEVLEVTYLLPDLHVTDEDRKYYGYLVSVYYKNALQDYRSDPTALAQRATPPAALAQDPTP